MPIIFALLLTICSLGAVATDPGQSIASFTRLAAAVATNTRASIIDTSTPLATSSPAPQADALANFGQTVQILGAVTLLFTR
jgi:hypothetical protein